jgi:uncharacterized protein
MEIRREQNDAQYQIRKYSPGCITVNEQEYSSSILVMPQYFSAWAVQDINSLQEINLLALLDLRPDVILLGTGDKLVFPASNITQTVTNKKVGLEIMTTDAACRTYTILVAEGRNVLAALLINKIV